MRRSFAHRGGLSLHGGARSIGPGRLSIGVLIVIGSLHLAASALLDHSARAFLSPRFTLVIAAVFLGLVAIGTMRIELLATLLVLVPAMQLGMVSAAGIVFNPTLILGAALSLVFIFRLFSRHAVIRRAWTVTGKISLWTILAALAAVILSSVANSLSLLNCVPWFVGAGVALSLIASARLGYLRPSVIPVTLLSGFAISATSDLRQYLRGTAIDTGINAGRFVGGLGDYELLGEFYAIAIVIALATLVHVRRLEISLLAAYVIGLGLFLVFATQGRSPLILLAIACPLLLVTPFIRRSVSKSRLLLIFAVTASAGVVFAPYVYSSNTVARLLGGVVTQGDFATTINRSSIWPLILTDSKFLSSGLFGNGPVGAYEWFGTYPHSLVLWTIWSLGITGCIFLALLAATGISGIAQWRRNGWITVLLGFSLVILLVDQIKIEFPRESSMILFVLTLCALTGAASIAEEGDILGHFAE